VSQAYKRDENDEFVLPTLVNKLMIDDGDSVICFNYRPDRVRQISRALTQDDFAGFARPVNPKIYYICLTEYDASLNLSVAFTPEQFPSQDMHNTLPEYLACHHIGQFHTAETEKYAHVTYFFNGGKEAPNEGEERQLVPSARVATYDLEPAMKTPEICDVACESIMSNKYPFLILNFANPDMVGHTGIFDAAVEAVNSVDEAFGRLLAATEAVQGTLVITSDHGNVEQMIDKATGQPHTAHTTNPVPFIVADFSGTLKNDTHLANGCLADVAPTILDIMKMKKPPEMTGKSLLNLMEGS
jgi:2,3-bisphosphoglycerate-independent phosphoglycerate mutase